MPRNVTISAEVGVLMNTSSVPAGLGVLPRMGEEDVEVAEARAVRRLEPAAGVGRPAHEHARAGCHGDGADGRSAFQEARAATA